MEIIELQVFPPPQRIFPSPKENGKITILAQSFSCSCSNLMVLEPWGYLSWSQSILPCAHNTCWNSTFSDTRWFGLLLYKKDSPLELHCMVFMWLVIRWRNWVWESFSEKVIHSLAWNDYFKFRFFPFLLTGEALATYPQIKLGIDGLSLGPIWLTGFITTLAARPVRVDTYDEGVRTAMTVDFSSSSYRVAQRLFFWLCSLGKQPNSFTGRDESPWEPITCGRWP